MLLRGSRKFSSGGGSVYEAYQAATHAAVKVRPSCFVARLAVSQLHTFPHSIVVVHLFFSARCVHCIPGCTAWCRNGHTRIHEGAVGAGSWGGYRGTSWKRRKEKHKQTNLTKCAYLICAAWTVVKSDGLKQQHPPSNTLPSPPPFGRGKKTPACI